MIWRRSSALDGEDLFIRNEVHCCRGLRKLHLETARLGLGLQILHCVIFPDPRFDLPVFGADIVASPAGISAAIVDLSPVGDQLPERIGRALERTPIPAFEQVGAPHGERSFLLCALHPTHQRPGTGLVR